jgi:small subunit ribosomal protein S2
MTEQKLLVELEDYLKSGLHIGNKFRTKFMSNFIYKVRPDGLSILNVEAIDERLRLAVKMISQYEPKDIVVICRRENGFKPVKQFSKLTGIDMITGRYRPGRLTNVELEDFTEKKLIIVCDPIPDKNAVRDASKLGIVVVGLCDSNNECKNIDLVVACNNKGKKSLGLVFYILAREFLLEKKLIKSEKDFKYSLEDFAEE